MTDVTARIRELRASVVPGGGADYHDQAPDHWIDGQIATPMSRYPEYRMNRSSYGLNALGTLVIEVETEAGDIGVGCRPAACQRAGSRSTTSRASSSASL